MNEDTVLFSELPKFKRTPLGPLSEEWKVVGLGEVARIAARAQPHREVGILGDLNLLFTFNIWMSIQKTLR
jgi:hypothetical protein